MDRVCKMFLQSDLEPVSEAGCLKGRRGENLCVISAVIVLIQQLVKRLIVLFLEGIPNGKG